MFRLGYPSPFWEIGLGAAEVEVDSETGEVKILRYVSLTDAGKMIHPIQCHAQDEGAAVFGIGQALFEDLVYRDGQLVNGSLVDYRLPRFDDLPESFTTYIMEGGGGRDRTVRKAWEKGNSGGGAGGRQCCTQRHCCKDAGGAADTGNGLEGDQQSKI